MAYTAFDPRSVIISTIGHSIDFNGDDIDESCVSVIYPDSDSKGDRCYIPMYVASEARYGELPHLPFIEVTLVDAPVETHNVQGDVKMKEAYIDFNIYAVNTDNINIKTWMPVVKNELIDKLTEYRQVVSGVEDIEVTNSGREIFEVEGGQTTFHHVISIYSYSYDSG